MSKHTKKPEPEPVERRLQVNLHISCREDLMALHRLMSVVDGDQFSDFNIIDDLLVVVFDYSPEQEGLLVVSGLGYDG